jgi:periplasmic protein CpxP/Spy
MYRINPRRTISALGMSMAVAIVAAAQTGAAQTPRTLPATPQNQDRAQTRQQDPQIDSRDPRATRGPEDRLERRLAYLHSQLRITPVQEGAWTKFTAALRDETRDRDRDRVQGGTFNDREPSRGRSGRRDDRASDARQGPSVVERLEERQRMVAEQSADLDHVLAALRPLYASFTADQRRTADRLMFQPREDGRGSFDDRRGPGGDGRDDPRRDYR